MLSLLLTLILFTTLRPPAFVSAILLAFSLSDLRATVPESSILSLLSFTATPESSGCC